MSHPASFGGLQWYPGAQLQVKFDLGSRGGAVGEPGGGSQVLSLWAIIEVNVTTSGGAVTVSGGAVTVCVCSTVDCGSVTVKVVPASV